MSETFGQVIVRKRKLLNLSQRELASRILREDGAPISPAYLNDIEHDRRSPASEHMVGEFARVLGEDEAWLTYLVGRFPYDLRGLSKRSFEEGMVAFRRTVKS